jgi:hypothetical protein
VITELKPTEVDGQPTRPGEAPLVLIESHRSNSSIKLRLPAHDIVYTLDANELECAIKNARNH